MRILRSHLAALLLAPLVMTHLVGCASSHPSSPAALQIEPSSVDIAPGEAVKFTSVTQESVVWSVLEDGGGTIDANGMYTAPSNEGTYHIIATAKSGAVAGRAQVRIARTNAAAVAVSPRAASVATGESLTFEATVSGTADTTVTWSVEEGAAGGAITAAGVYTAPASAGVYHVVATSETDPSKSGSATVTVTEPPPPPPPTEPPPPTGPQFFVATNGNDANPGTEAQPWRTIQKAMNSATPGSTVNIRGGTYPELLTMNVSGTADAPITFQPYGFQGSTSCGGYTGKSCPGETVVLDYSSFGTMTQVKPALLISGKKYIVIQGLVFQNYRVDGAMHVAIQLDRGTEHVDFRWILVKNFQNVHPDGRDGTTMLAVFRAGWGSTGANYVTVADSAFLNSKTNMSEVVTFDLGSSYGLVERTWVSDTDLISLHCFRGAHHLTFRDNRVDYSGMKRDGTFWGADFGRGPGGIALYNDGCHDTVWERNIVTHSSYGFQTLQEPANPDYGLPSAGDAYNVAFRDNVIRDSYVCMTLGTWYSTTDGSTVHDSSIYNNTFYGCSTGFMVRPFDRNTVKVRNNIVASCGTAWKNSLGWNAGTALDYNLYFGGGTGPDVHQVYADPRFADPASDNFRLLPGSPAINAGEPTATTASTSTLDFFEMPRIVGGAVDVGAAEAQ